MQLGQETKMRNKSSCITTCDKADLLRRRKNSWVRKCIHTKAKVIKVGEVLRVKSVTAGTFAIAPTIF